MRWQDRLRNWLARILPRWLAVALAIRRLTPVDDRRRWPRASVAVTPAGDTGGGYRASLRQQDPSVDPREPGGGESSSSGTDHGWSNCTMASGATALAYQQPYGGKVPWGGDLRHRQGDQSGGTDLYDLADAWDSYGEALSIKSGQGWDAVKDCHDAGRALVVQGTGNVPGSATFDGGHACVIGPETHTDGRWLFGDPLCSGWQWVKPGEIKAWMERWQSSMAFAAGEKPPAPKPPDPEPEPAPKPPPAPPPVPPPGYSAGYSAGVRDGRALEADATFASWSPGRPWTPPQDAVGSRWDTDATWDGSGRPGAFWTVWPVPLRALWTAQEPATWGTAGWAAAVWRE